MNDSLSCREHFCSAINENLAPGLQNIPASHLADKELVFRILGTPTVHKKIIQQGRKEMQESIYIMSDHTNDKEHKSFGSSHEMSVTWNTVF